ncbi:unnamed protein product [Choristocarpus tenellus]
MTKEPHGKACKICDRPYTVFRWKAGTQGRIKSTQLCQTCAKLKNACQTCVLDLQYGETHYPQSPFECLKGRQKYLGPAMKSN